MAQMTKEQRLAGVHERAMRHFDEIHMATRDVRLECVQDRRFYSIVGAMWEDWLGDQFENSPKFEINKIAKAVISIISEYRANRITVDFRPKDDDADSDTADTLDGLYRADEQEFTAQEAYDNGFEEGIGGGQGAWRLRAVLEDEYAEDDEGRQRIATEPIFDADTSVYWGLEAKRYDKADAKRCFLISSMTPDGYDDEYPDQPVASFPKETLTTIFDWFTPEVVYIAEYYEVEERTETITIFGSRLPGQEEKRLTKKDMEDADQMSVLKVLQYRPLREVKKRSRAIHKYILNGAIVLEDCGRIAGKCIPIVPFYGKRWYVDNIERCQGEVRLSKDAQRLLNMQVSRLAEVSATAPFEVPILTPQQVAGHENSWAIGNIKRLPYRLINAIKNAVTGEITASGPVGQVKPPDVPPALAAHYQLTNTAIDDLTGSGGQAQPLVANVSNDAVETVQQQNDLVHFIYMDNMRKSMRRSGQIWLSMAKDLLVQEGRQMQSVDPEGKPKTITLMQPTLDDDGNQTVTNDPTQGNYDVWVDVGPSFASRRASVVRSIRGLMQNTQDPELLSVLTLTALLNMDGEGLDDVRAFARKKLIAMGAVKPTKDEQAELAQEQQAQPPDPNATFLAASAKKEDALASKAVADTALSEATRLKTLAQAQEIHADTHATTIDTHIGAANALADAARPRAPAPSFGA